MCGIYVNHVYVLLNYVMPHTKAKTYALSPPVCIVVIIIYLALT